MSIAISVGRRFACPTLRTSGTHVSTTGLARLPWQLLLLGAFVWAVYFSRLDALPFRGEETRWARVAWEMRETGDWIVPRCQGIPLYSRPPLQN